MLPFVKSVLCPTLLAAAVLLMALPALSLRAEKSAPRTFWKFDFGTGRAEPGALLVTPTTLYSSERGYGFETGSENGTSSRFSVALPEGNYTVRVNLGSATVGTETTIKAEARRLMLENVQTPPGRFASRVFTVNVRTPHIASGGSVHLTPREQGPPLSPTWDNKLTLEFNGAHPGVAMLEISPAESATTIFLAGDSTVTDQTNEPWAAWGQMLPRFFQEGIAVANYAESGRALSSFKAEKRLDKILSVMKPGDYVFIQFGHNDQKDKRPGAGPYTTYKTSLKEYIAGIKKGGGLPVLVTPMERRRWSADGKPQPTLADYAEAVRQTGREENIPVIDLNAMSLAFYTALGPEKSTRAFVHYPAGTFPGQAQALKDDTHFNNYGAYELARCIVTGIRAKVPDLAKRLANDAQPFDPSHPDPVERFSLPASPFATSEKPAGN